MRRGYASEKATNTGPTRTEKSLHTEAKAHIRELVRACLAAAQAWKRQTPNQQVHKRARMHAKVVHIRERIQASQRPIHIGQHVVAHADVRLHHTEMSPVGGQGKRALCCASVLASPDSRAGRAVFVA